MLPDQAADHVIVQDRGRKAFPLTEVADWNGVYIGRIEAAVNQSYTNDNVSLHGN